MLGMNIGQCQLSKLYAYNALLFTDGRRYRGDGLLTAEHIVVIDNPKSIVKNTSVITVEDDGSDNPVGKYHQVEQTADIEITEFDGEGLFDFVFEPGWKEKRDPKMMERMESVVYERNVS